MTIKTAKTIGIFDSGIGGLTIFKAVQEYCPQADIIYLGDTARLPYGTKSPETIAKYLQQNIQFLLQKNVDVIIVACNSASTILDQVKFDLPVHGVIVAGSKKAIATSLNKRIGVMGTKATVGGLSYTKVIKQLDKSHEVFEQACPLLVPMVEEGMIDDAITINMIERYVAPLLANQIDTIILGCTHYPILKETIQKIVGKDIKLVDSANCIGQIFQDQKFAGNGNHKFYLSDTSNSFIKMAKFILGKEDINLEHVNI